MKNSCLTFVLAVLTASLLHAKIPSGNVLYLDGGQDYVKLFAAGYWFFRGLIDELREWDGRDSHGNLVAAGSYVYQVECATTNGEKFVESKKMSLIK